MQQEEEAEVDIILRKYICLVAVLRVCATSAILESKQTLYVIKRYEPSPQSLKQQGSMLLTKPHALENPVSFASSKLSDVFCLLYFLGMYACTLSAKLLLWVGTNTLLVLFVK